MTVSVNIQNTRGVKAITQCDVVLHVTTGIFIASYGSYRSPDSGE